MTESTDAVSTTGEASGYDTLMLLIDPEWEPTDEAPEPPVSALLGAWPVTEAEGRGRFQANPIYKPATADSPLDPVDAVLRLFAQDDSDDDHLGTILETVLRDVMLTVALDEQGRVLVRPAPDAVPSVLVTTAPGHQRQLDVPAWLDVTVERLAKVLPASGVDVLLNPGSPVSMRVLADVIRRAAQADVPVG